ncbi:MAG: tetratricopeptide repeat protein [Bacteroidetes bacterium]|jgi:tetratricopeptide (TPR) repeat protein|nr:tetratricopeptide repeat protein [Bacteroidota bacterium]MBT3750465.1 tetratricopeptide repeat protein [Bacteroidota bacterium]MBT4398855.1 tetratricopeptide repeat protein [Bacteroidota bacterium]MBT4411612.1 tetratricopeptide repeat protein [Bacteroidota bacterium]MBT7093961.1 tetratricopeptide repeat protein [Bacteroidota bacterium]
MNDHEILSTYQKITDLLSVNRIKEALDVLLPMLTETGMGEWIRENEELDSTYKYMLKYTVDGIQDPERQKVYQKLVARIYTLTDKVKEFLLTRESVAYLHVQKRIFRDEWAKYGSTGSFLNINDFVASREHDSSAYNQRLSFLFKLLWLTDVYKESEKKLVKTWFSSAELLHEEQAALVSALNMSLWRVFDEGKFELLFELFDSEDEQIRQRALMGLLLAFYKYDNRLKVYPAIRSRFLLYDEHGGFKKYIEEIIVQMIRSKDTEKLTKRMQEEILPEMIKLTPHLKKKLDLDKLLKETLGEDQNPEWEELFDDSPELKGKMEELSELQMEGSDVFMSSFSMLKHFPFFSHIPNWFFPFTAQHPDIEQLSSNNSEDWFVKFMEAITDSSFMCNSDKYSFCYSIQSMPDDMKKFLSDGLKAESEQMGEILKDEELLNTNMKAEKVIRQYAQDLYRFFKLHPEKKAFDDLFEWPLDFHNKSFFQDLFINEDKILLTLGEFYFRTKYYKEASDVYKVLIASGSEATEVLQKIGYCYQKLGDFDSAISYYLKADILLPENIWNLKKIALCYRHLNKPEKALSYFQQAELLDSEDLHTEVSMGHCLLEMEEFEKALKSYFKVEYLNPDNQKVWRPIAWCSFVLGKFDQARKYYLKLLDESPNHFDMMNLGHLEWCEGKRTEAVERYKESVNRQETSMEQFMESFEEDKKYLLQFGVEQAEIPIMLDHLRYSLEE